MSLAIGADLMTYDQYLSLAAGRKYFTPNGQLYGPSGEEYVVSSLRESRDGTIDIEDREFPTDPKTRTRHYTGLVEKWMRRDAVDGLFYYVGGSCLSGLAEDFAASRRNSGRPDYCDSGFGFLSSVRV